ncbi:hypothetical protein [Paenalkalicoccus suaedae]|nr:hypothetical protein [Paenalkalicoccus suaedae]
MQTKMPDAYENRSDATALSFDAYAWQVTTNTSFFLLQYLLPT